MQRVGESEGRGGRGQGTATSSAIAVARYALNSPMKHYHFRHKNNRRHSTQLMTQGTWKSKVLANAAGGHWEKQKKQRKNREITIAMAYSNFQAHKLYFYK